MDRKEALRMQIRELREQIKRTQHLGLVTSTLTFLILLICGFNNPFAFTFTLVPYVVATLASFPLMVELNRRCKELTGKH